MANPDQFANHDELNHESRFKMARQVAGYSVHTHRPIMVRALCSVLLTRCACSRSWTLVRTAETPQSQLVQREELVRSGIRVHCICFRCSTPFLLSSIELISQPRPTPANEDDGYSAVKYYSTFQEPGKKQHATHGSAGDLAAMDQVEDPQRAVSPFLSSQIPWTVPSFLCCGRTPACARCAEHTSQQACSFFCQAW